MYIMQYKCRSKTFDLGCIMSTNLLLFWVCNVFSCVASLWSFTGSSLRCSKTNRLCEHKHYTVQNSMEIFSSTLISKYHVRSKSCLESQGFRIFVTVWTDGWEQVWPNVHGFLWLFLFCCFRQENRHGGQKLGTVVSAKQRPDTT